MKELDKIMCYIYASCVLSGSIGFVFGWVIGGLYK